MKQPDFGGTQGKLTKSIVEYKRCAYEKFEQEVSGVFFITISLDWRYEMEIGCNLPQHPPVNGLEVLQEGIVGVNAGHVRQRKLAQLSEMLKCSFLLEANVNVISQSVMTGHSR